MNQNAPIADFATSFSVENDTFRQMIEGVRELFWLCNPEVSQFLYVSPACERIFGRSAQDVLDDAQVIWEMIHPDDHENVKRFLQETIERGESGTEFRVVCADRSIRWVRDRSFALRDRDGEVVYLAGLVEDITDWKQIERDLRTEADYYRLISDLTADYAYKTRIHPDGSVIVEAFSDGFARVTGYTLEELNAKGGWAALIHPDDLEECIRVNEALPTMERVVGEVRIVTKFGETRHIRYSSQMFRSTPGGPVDYIYGASQDITERHLAKERLRELSHRLFEVQEQERRRVALELHDEVGQNLTALCLQLDSIRLGSDDAAGNLEEARRIVRRLTTQVRSMSLELRPSMLDDLGLVPALIWLFDRYKAGQRLRIEFEHAGLSGRFPPAAETACYRIVQEALTNVQRHAGVSRARVRAWLADDHVHLTIEDAGRGFNVDSARKSGLSAGLSGMQERAALLGGELSIESIPERGTRVAAKLPLVNFERISHS
jgi:PAS domain S-box-containing protein